MYAFFSAKIIPGVGFYLPGSGKVGKFEHILWLGHPSHASALPASSLLVPGQPIQIKLPNNTQNIFNGNRNTQYDFR